MSKLFLNGLLNKDKQVLVPLLETYFSRGVFPDEIPVVVHTNKTKDTAFHPSSHTGCARTVYADMAGDYVKPKPTAGLQRTFHIGHLLHGWLQELFVDMGLCAESDVEQLHRRSSTGDVLTPDVPFEELSDILEPLMASGGWWAQGAIDIARCRIPEHGDYIVDFKTVRGMAMREENPFGGFREKYENQMQVYMDWTGIDRAILLAVGKDTPHGFKEIIVERDPSKAEAIYERWDTIAAALVSGNPPVCTCSDPASCDTRGLYGKPTATL